MRSTIACCNGANRLVSSASIATRNVANEFMGESIELEEGECAVPDAVSGMLSGRGDETLAATSS